MILKERLRHILTSLSNKIKSWLGRVRILKQLMGVNYGVIKHISIRPIETFLTKQYPGFTQDQIDMLTSKHYYKYDEMQDWAIMMEYRNINRTIPGIKELVKDIVEEHYNMTKNVDQNLHYLWHLYNKGTKAGEYRPFMLLAEIQLLKALDYITEDEAHNMFNMMQSEDTDNLNLVYLSILNMRKQRIEDYGEYKNGKVNVTAPLYNIVQDYSHTIMSQELFMKCFTKSA
jgi:hypothetical protein